MSKISLAPNASGTGTLTISAPNTNTDRTIALPDAAGTVFVSGQALSATTGSFSGTVSGGSTIGVGGATPSASGAGITFPATQSASSDANTLDDYERGNWTPSVGGTATYHIQNGEYVKIGRVVTVIAKLEINSIGTGSTSTISGLPFTALNSTNASTAMGTVGYFGALSQNVIKLDISPNNNATVATLLGLTAAASTAIPGIAVLQNSSRIDFSFTYISNS